MELMLALLFFFASDDTQSLQQAINAGNVQLQAKTYVLSAPIRVKNSIAGTKGSVLLFKSPTPLDAGLIVDGQNVSLSGFSLKGEGTSLTHGIDITSSKNIKLDHLQVDGIQGMRQIATAGIFLGNDDGVWIQNSEFTDIGTATAKSSFAIWNYYGKRSQNIHVDHNQFHNNSANIVVGLFDTEHSTVSNNVIDQGNICVDPCKNNGYGIIFYQMDHSQPTPTDDAVLDNHVTNTAGSAIYFASVNNVKAAGNTILNSSQKMNDVSLPAAGIALNVVDTGEISGNVIRSDANGGICLATTKHISVHDNQIHDSGKWGMHLRVANSDTAITHNVIDGAPIDVLREHDAVTTKMSNNQLIRVQKRATPN